MKYSSSIEKAKFICLASFLRMFVHPFGVQIFASATIGNENNPSLHLHRAANQQPGQRGGQHLLGPPQCPGGL